MHARIEFIGFVDRLLLQVRVRGIPGQGCLDRGLLVGDAVRQYRRVTYAS